jgi:hypothetical protein
MGRIRKRPKFCTHPSCEGGECGKCGYNPQSGYVPFHFSGGGKKKDQVALPGGLALFVGVASGYVGALGCDGLHDSIGLIRGALIVVVGVLVSLGVVKVRL